MSDKIRQDINKINMIPITLAGKCALMAFDPEPLETALEILTLKLTGLKMDSKQKWENLYELSKEYSRDYFFRVDYLLAISLKKELGVEGRPHYEEEVKNNYKEVEITTKDTKFNFLKDLPEWETPAENRDKFLEDNYKNAYRFEVNRPKGDTEMNPFWSFLLCSHKSKLIGWFPYLEELYPYDKHRAKKYLAGELEKVPDQFQLEFHKQKPLRTVTKQASSQEWSSEDKALIAFVKNNWDQEILGDFASPMAVKIFNEIARGPGSIPAQDGTLREALTKLKDIIEDNNDIEDFVGESV